VNQPSEPQTTGGQSNGHFRLVALFAAIYFVQGISEPTEGLLSQPVKSLLRSWGRSATEIGTFMALVSLPWSVKWLFGLLTDFVPFCGYRRRSYLMAASGAAAAGLLTLFVVPLGPGGVPLLLILLLLPSIGIAFCDVVSDALMVEHGQPLGLTGRLQSIQWASIYTATVLTGVVGGYLSAHRLQHLGFAICGVACLLTLLLALFSVREPKHAAVPQSFRGALASLWRIARTPQIVSVAGFIFLWHFNPFSHSVLYLHVTNELELGEQFFGEMTSLVAVASVLASVAFGFYCRRVPLDRLIHASIAMGVLSTFAYIALEDRTSARLISLVAGAATMTAVLIQLDLAARVCPPESAGTVFSFIMGLSNLSVALSESLGGYLYDELTLVFESRDLAFHILVAIGALLTACCWLLVPFLRRQSFVAPRSGGV
jgi:MFS family permease